MFGVEDNIIDLIRIEISKYCTVEDIIIFGSRAKGNFKKGSDIDLAIKSDDITFENLNVLKAKINQEFPIPYQVDLINYKTISNDDLKNHINRVGISILK